MPRKSDKPSRNRAAVKQIHAALGESSASSSSFEEDADDFRSVSTNLSGTNYQLDYTNQTNKPKKARGATTTSKSPTTRSKDAPTRTLQTSSRTQLGEPSGLSESLTPGRRSTPKTVAANRNSSRELRSAQGRSVTPQRRDSARVTAGNPKTQQRPQTSPQKPGKSRKRKQEKPKRNAKVLQEIRHLQHTTELIIPKLPFSRLIKEIIMERTRENFRIKPAALQCLQEAAEAYLVQLFEDANRCTLHRDRVTLFVKDIELVRYLRGSIDPGNN